MILGTSILFSSQLDPRVPRPKDIYPTTPAGILDPNQNPKLFTAIKLKENYHVNFTNGEIFVQVNLYLQS